jgi:hypothetical protein
VLYIRVWSYQEFSWKAAINRELMGRTGESSDSLLVEPVAWLQHKNSSKNEVPFIATSRA